MDRHESVEDAIKRIYAVFGRVPRPAAIDHSPIAVRDEDAAALLAAPVGRVPTDTMERYTFKAMSTWGDTVAFRYYLPQVLDGARSSELWLIANKLAYGDWRTWPAAEQAAIEAWAFARARAAMACPSASEWMAAAKLVTDLGLGCASLVDPLLSASDEASVLEIALLIVRHDAEIYRTRSFGMLAFDALLYSPEVRARLEAMFLASTTASEARLLGEAVQVLEWLDLRR